jgi:menaquinone-9 beta-reductase
MNPNDTYDVIFVGGGLAALVGSQVLAQQGHRVLVVERKAYPFHRVCGEYVSNETLPFLQSLGFDPFEHGAARIERFRFTSPSGKALDTPLDLGGFGLSRYVLDEQLYRLALRSGVVFALNTIAESVDFQQNTHFVSTQSGCTFEARVVIGAQGKHSKIDHSLGRAFLRQRSPYVGVKYHIATDFPKDLIALHNFADGYCGISAIEQNRYCLCYLTTRENLRRAGSIASMEHHILSRNPHLRTIFEEATFLYDKPEVINEFSFAPKTTIENHVLMVGDAAGLITPLCGNGMALAIHGGKIVAEHADDFLANRQSRTQLEQAYRSHWQGLFARRLWVGRQVQRLFGDEWLSEVAGAVLGRARPVLKFIIKNTHGNIF